MNTIPSGWTSAVVKDVVDIIDYRGRTPPFSPAGIPHIRASNVKNGKIVWEGLKFVSEETYQSYMTRGLPQRGDLLFTTEAPMGEVALAPTERFSLAQRMMLLRPSKMLLPQFLLYQLMSERFQQSLKVKETGTTVTGVSSKNFRPLPFLIAPLNEQRRIVAKVEKLLTLVTAAQERLATIPRILKRFRQSVLAAACSGRLTSDWREKNSTDFLVTDSLTRLFKERLGNTHSINQEKTLRLIYDYKENNQSDNLPDGWRFVALDKLCERFDYGTSSKSKSIGRVPVLRMGNIQNGEIDWTDLVYTSDEREIAKYMLEPNTVLFNRTNSPELVGKTAIYRGERPAIFAGYLIRIKNYYQVLDSAYLNYSLNTQHAREFCLSVKTDGVSQSNINAQKLAKFEVPFCSLTEQQEILRRVEGLFKTADALEARYLKAKAHVDKLTQSILAKAFRGELVPQDHNDEPASVLLERITGEPNGSAAVKRRSQLTENSDQ